MCKTVISYVFFSFFFFFLSIHEECSFLSRKGSGSKVTVCVCEKNHDPYWHKENGVRIALKQDAGVR